ncbi:MAG: ATP-binding cassette domain-containing protein [Actinomycetia bacterium]|nr:ATP-binding cassette domain-containing protein [Actinomycetes bacterium]
MSASVAARQVAHRFPGTGWLFEDVSFDLVPGRISVVTGPSGCGKSTLLALLAGWEQPALGTITRQGTKKVRWVFQNPHGVAARTALDMVGFAYLVQGMTRREADEAARSVLERFGLAGVASRNYATLSGGEAQRLMLAQAVASRPDLLLVDEPTAQLDRAMAESVTASLEALAAEDMIVVVATHDQAVVRRAAHVIDLEAAHKTARADGPRT